MRIGEVCGLRWCDVDFETGLISIRHSVAYAKGMGSFIKDTKTHDARGIPIDPVGLLPFLKETHEIDCGKLRLRGLTGAVEIGDCYILSEPGATFATTSYIRRAFKTFSETNGLMGTNDELITFHGLRHTFATQWIRQGGDIKALQSILGHKDAMATLNVYADIEPISKIHNMLRATPCLWRGHLGPRVDPGPMFQQSPTEDPGVHRDALGVRLRHHRAGRPKYRHTRREDEQLALAHRVRGSAGPIPTEVTVVR